MPVFATPEPITLRADVTAGRIEVTASDRDDTSVEVRPVKQSDADYVSEVLVEFDDGTLTIKTPDTRGLRRVPSIEVVVGLPSGSRLSASSASADITASGTLQDVEAKSASGDVSIERAADVRIKTASGDVDCDVIDGSATITSASGTVNLSVVHGALQLTTTSGDAVIHEAGHDVSAKSASGDLDIRLIRQGKLAANSASGDVHVAVAHGVPVWLEVSSLSGKVRSQLERGQEPGEGEDTVEINARTISGDITITRTGA